MFVALEPITITGPPLTWWQAWREDIIVWVVGIGSIVVISSLLAKGGK